MIVISGASRGIGKKIREELVSENMVVVGLARTADKEKNILQCDVADYQSVKKIYQKIISYNESVDAIISAAGIASMNLAITTPENVTRKIINTNLLGTIFMNQVFAPLLIRQNYGRIINFSTIAVKLGLKGESIYVASKAGVEGFTKSFAREMSDFNITVNCIAPGPIKTDLLKGISEEQILKITDQQIFKKTYKPSDVVSVVKMILSKESQSITGQIFHIGGI